MNEWNHDSWESRQFIILVKAGAALAIEPGYSQSIDWRQSIGLERNSINTRWGTTPTMYTNKTRKVDKPKH